MMQMGAETRAFHSSHQSREVFPFVLSSNCKSISAIITFAGGSFRLDRALGLRKDTVLNLASPTEVEMFEGCNWSLMAAGAVQSGDNPYLVETLSD